MNLAKIEQLFPEMKDNIRTYNNIARNLAGIENAMEGEFDPNGFWELKTENEARSWVIVKKVGNIYEILRDYSAYNDYGGIFLSRLEDQLFPDEYADERVKGPRTLKGSVRVYCGYDGIDLAVGIALNAPKWFKIKETKILGHEITCEIE